MKPVTMVVTDLDGTMLDSHKVVSPKTREAIKQLKEHGILFGIASGRPVESGLILCDGWGLRDSISFLIGMNGGVLYDMRTGQKDVYSHMDGELLLDIIHYYKKHPEFTDLHFEVMDGNKRYVEWSSQATLDNADLYGEREIIVNYDEFLKGRRFNKLIIRSLPEEQPALIEVSRGYHNDQVVAFPTSDVLFEYVDPNINKGFGVQRACEHFGLNLENVVAFGDESNDIEMLSIAGTGVAMKNATPPVKAVADVILDRTNDEDGEATYIENVVIANADGKLERA